MPDDTDVVPAGEPSTPASPTPDTASVPAAVDRPIENLAGEMNRKFSQLRSQMDTLQQYLVAQQQSQAAIPPSQSGKPATDEELWGLAQQGNREAFNVYMERIADRKSDARFKEEDRQQRVERQLGTLALKYPVLNDTTHPLSQVATAAYQLLIQGGEPANRATLLEAIKLAIADRPDLVAEVYSRQMATPSATRRAQAGQTGNAPHTMTPPTQPRKPTKAQLELAKRMGVPDPAKAMERFYKRQEAGQSHLGAVSSFVREEE